MGQKEKLIAKLKSKPKDFTFGELEQLLKYFGYELSNKGRISGSRIIFPLRTKLLFYFINRTAEKNCWNIR